MPQYVDDRTASAAGDSSAGVKVSVARDSEAERADEAAASLTATREGSAAARSLGAIEEVAGGSFCSVVKPCCAELYFGNVNLYPFFLVRGATADCLFSVHDALQPYMKVRQR